MDQQGREAAEGRKDEAAAKWIAGALTAAKANQAWAASMMSDMEEAAMSDLPIGLDLDERFEKHGDLGAMLGTLMRAHGAGGADLVHEALLRAFLDEAFGLMGKQEPMGRVVVFGSDQLIFGSADLPPDILDLGKRLREMRGPAGENGGNPAPPKPTL